MRVLLRLLTGSLTIFEQTAINYSNHTVINNYAKQIVKKTAKLCIFLRTKQKIHDIIQIVNRNKRIKNEEKL